MIQDKKHLLVPGMAFVPEAAHLCEALFSFGPQQSKPDLNVKKNLEDVQNSIMSILRHKFENEINSEDVENMRWAVFASFNRRVEDESLMTSKEKIVQV